MPVEISVGPAVLTINQGRTFMVTAPDGSIQADSELGVFSDDTRFLSYYEVSANGQRWRSVTSAAVAYYAALVFLTNGEVVTEEAVIPAGTVSLQVRRAVGDGIHEDLDLINYNLLPVAFNL